MLGVKLTILGTVLFIFIVFILKIAVAASSTKTKMCIAFNDYPMWFDVMSCIAMVLFVLDAIGLVYSTIWLLFLK